MNTETACALCGCQRTPAEIEYLPQQTCAECAEISEELAHFCRAGRFHGEPAIGIGSVAASSGFSGKLTISCGSQIVEHEYDDGEPVARIPPPRPSPLARVRVRENEPWGVLALIALALAALVWGLA